jgi:hypothetical protein
MMRYEQKYFNMTQTLDVEATRTTVIVDKLPFRIYEYRNNEFIDIIIRDVTGNIIDHRHPKFQAIGNAYVDSTPED